MRSWTTFKRPLKWGGIIDKPSILADNQIDWEEVQNKPTVFPPDLETYNGATSFGQAIGSLVTGTASGRLERGWLNGHYTIFLDNNGDSDSFAVVSRQNYSANSPNPDFLALRLFSHGYLQIGRGIIANLPTSSIGLPANYFYRDSNGFVKIV